MEQHQLLPKTHFGGRPGRTTTDAIHYLVHKVKRAWANDQVASVLFLDIKGAFPNAVTDLLIHNLKSRRKVEEFWRYTQNLSNSYSQTEEQNSKFDDFTSETINVINGIGQGDPLSMLLYIIYNASLLEITDNDEHEDALGYVDDIALLAIGGDFVETTARLKNMMEKHEGGLEWSEQHNSRFEISKSAILHLSRKTTLDPEVDNHRIPLYRPALTVNGDRPRECLSVQYTTQKKRRKRCDGGYGVKRCTTKGKQTLKGALYEFRGVLE